MKKPVRAALLSALVFPGVGHFFLRKHFRGALLASIGFVGLAVATIVMLGRAAQIVEKIRLGEVSPDFASILNLISNQTANGDTQLLTIASTSFFVVWVLGIADSYRVGRINPNKVDSTA